MAHETTFNRKKSVRTKRLEIGFLSLGVFFLITAVSFAAPANFEKIKELEKAEKAPPPERLERPQMPYSAGNLRDPFQRQVVRPAGGGKTASGQESPESSGQSTTVEMPLPPLTVQGVIWGGIFPQAIVNNKVVKVGDTIKAGYGDEEIKIIGIDKDGVNVSFGDRQFKLTSPATGGSSKSESP